MQSASRTVRTSVNSEIQRTFVISINVKSNVTTTALLSLTGKVVATEMQILGLTRDAKRVRVRSRINVKGKVGATDLLVIITIHVIINSLILVRTAMHL